MDGLEFANDHVHGILRILTNLLYVPTDLSEPNRFCEIQVIHF